MSTGVNDPSLTLVEKSERTNTAPTATQPTPTQPTPHGPPQHFVRGYYSNLTYSKRNTFLITLCTWWTAHEKTHEVHPGESVRTLEGSTPTRRRGTPSLFSQLRVPSTRWTGPFNLQPSPAVVTWDPSDRGLRTELKCSRQRSVQNEGQEEVHYEGQEEEPVQSP